MKVKRSEAVSVKVNETVLIEPSSSSDVVKTLTNVKKKRSLDSYKRRRAAAKQKRKLKKQTQLSEKAGTS